ncbi:MAG: nuclear transport factor 2 family protein [Xanthomonadales bacterium]|nr:nuclear transport factor 2 family protein [Xanthomonadales bacterium]
MNKAMHLVLYPLTFVLGACVGGSNNKPVYSVEYLKSDEIVLGTADKMQWGIDQFQTTFSDLKTPELSQRIETLYAEQFYFNDTFRSFKERTELIAYLEETSTRLVSSDIEFQKVIIDGQDAYLRWVMDMKFSAGGKDIHSHSIGMTQLRFNEQGQIVFHQDFWDSAHGFYQHLPVIGGLIHWVQNKL